jgi:hypothetical protein
VYTIHPAATALTQLVVRDRTTQRPRSHAHGINTIEHTFASVSDHLIDNVRRRHVLLLAADTSELLIASDPSERITATEHDRPTT